MRLPPPDRWYPDGTKSSYQPPAEGDLIAVWHGVWRVIRVQDVEPTEEETSAWIESGMEDWNKPTPYEVAAEAIAGNTGEIRKGKSGLMRVSRTGKSSHRTWNVYTRGRYPICSCCGEPTPCRETLIDERVEYSTAKDDEFASIPPGVCWACREPVTQRQKSVTYDGMNLDSPLAPSPVFHTRQKCWWDASKYEERWRTADPRRARIITREPLPKCHGSVMVHSDDTTECVDGVPGCGGGDHAHAVHFWCRAEADDCGEHGCADAAPGMRVRWAS